MSKNSDNFAMTPTIQQWNTAEGTDVFATDSYDSSQAKKLKEEK